MFTAALFSIAKNWEKKNKQTEYPAARENINKLWFISIMEYYPAVRRNELLIHAAM